MNRLAVRAKLIAVVGIIANFGENLEEGLEDNHLDFWERVKLIVPSGKLLTYADDVPDIIDYTKTMSEEERQELIEVFAKEFDLDNDIVELSVEFFINLIDKCLEITADLKEIIRLIKENKEAKNG